MRFFPTEIGYVKVMKHLFYATRQQKIATLNFRIVEMLSIHRIERKKISDKINIDNVTEKKNDEHKLSFN